MWRETQPLLLFYHTTGHVARVDYGVPNVNFFIHLFSFHSFSFIYSLLVFSFFFFSFFFCFRGGGGGASGNPYLIMLCSGFFGLSQTNKI